MGDTVGLDEVRSGHICLGWDTDGDTVLADWRPWFREVIGSASSRSVSSQFWGAALVRKTRERGYLLDRVGRGFVSSGHLARTRANDRNDLCRRGLPVV
jgi:hypothetical protein